MKLIFRLTEWLGCCQFEYYKVIFFNPDPWHAGTWKTYILPQNIKKCVQFLFVSEFKLLLITKHFLDTELTWCCQFEYFFSRRMTCWKTYILTQNFKNVYLSLFESSIQISAYYKANFFLDTELNWWSQFE